MASCDSTPPEGAAKPAELPDYSQGTCPEVSVGRNTIESVTGTREFLLIVPEDMEPDEELPLVVFWAWLTGDATMFEEIGELQDNANKHRIIAVVPEPDPDLLFTWPFDILSSDQRLEDEFVFFDDMLACVSEQFTVNENCVSSAGVSAGALFTSQLAGRRDNVLSSIVVASGGVAGGLIKPWVDPDHKMPALVLWGGEIDNCVGLLDFQQTSLNLEMELEEGEHFVVECIHNCGHAEPPFDGNPVTPMVDFILSHPFWLEPGESPYIEEGLPGSFPDWCAVGAGQAEPRTGECAQPSRC